jgi:hypothetical protein
VTTDPWQAMLLAIEPAYLQWKDEMELGPKFTIETKILSNVTWLCQIRIKEEWDLDSLKLNEVIEWTTEQLAAWPNCKRTSWDRWEFKNLRDSQKFKTLFILKWAR